MGYASVVGQHTSTTLSTNKGLPENGDRVNIDRDGFPENGNRVNIDLCLRICR